MGRKQSKMFKMLTSLVVVTILLVTVIVPAYAKEAAKAPTLNKTEAKLLVGETLKLEVKNLDSGAKVEFKTSNKKVATVDQNGLVTGLGKGKVKVSLRILTLTNLYRLSADITVIKPAVKVTIKNPVESLKLKDYYKFKAELTPASSNDIVIWSSSDTGVAKIMEDGSLLIKKAGTVTFTATCFGGRSNSVTIKVIGDEAAVVVEKKETEEVVEEKKEDVKVLKTILKEDFATSVGSFTGRGAAAVSQTTAGITADSAKGYMKVTGRTATWNGAITDVSKLVEPGATYRVTGWVRYTAGEDMETFKITQERTSAEDSKYVPISEDLVVKKGKWTLISGTLQVTPSTSQSLVYFETASLIDFYVDHVVIEKIDAAPVEGEKIELQKVKAGDTVIKRDFEDDKVLEPRGSSIGTITTANAKNGKASLEVKRSAGWDGAGFSFSAENKIVKASYFGRTVHVSAYVMYKDGADEVNFKLNNKMETVDNGDNILSQIAVKKGEWTLIEADCNIAKDATGNLIFIETENDGALTFYIDDFTISVVK